MNASEIMKEKMKKLELEREHLIGLRQKIRREEQKMQDETEAELKKLDEMEILLEHDHVSAGEHTEIIRQKLKEYNRYAADCEQNEFQLFEKKIWKLEEEIESIRREEKGR